MAQLKSPAVAGAAAGGAFFALGGAGEVAHAAGWTSHLALLPWHWTENAVGWFVGPAWALTQVVLVLAALAVYAVAGAFAAGVARANQGRCITTNGNCRPQRSCRPSHDPGWAAVLWPAGLVVALVGRVVARFHHTALQPAFNTGVQVKEGMRPNWMNVRALEEGLRATPFTALPPADLEGQVAHVTAAAEHAGAPHAAVMTYARHAFDSVERAVGYTPCKCGDCKTVMRYAGVTP